MDQTNSQTQIRNQQAEAAIYSAVPVRGWILALDDSFKRMDKEALQGWIKMTQFKEIMEETKGGRFRNHLKQGDGFNLLTILSVINKYNFLQSVLITCTFEVSAV